MSTRDEQLIGPMAAFIGARLQYPCPDINGQGNPWTSTIHVSQHKEKFFFIRVYCNLADDKLVAQYWAFLKDRERRQEGGEQFYTKMRQNVVDMVKQNDEPPRDFFQRCVKHDAIHYRKVYMEMVALQPHLLSKICSGADHGELLFKQVDEALKELDERMSKSDDWHKSYLKKYYVDTVEELKALFQVIYNPSIRDVMELRD